MNYYVDSTMLAIKEQNIYTATEIATLLPLRGIDIFGDFFRANRWVIEYLPNHLLKISYLKSEKSNLVSKLISKVLSNKMGDVLDDLLMRITARRSSIKTNQRKLDRNGAVVGSEVNKHYLKPLTENFQAKLLQRFEIKRCIAYATLRHKPAPDLMIS